MTIKRAIAIGTLSAITITLIAFGIKTKSFKPKTTTPNTQHRSAIRVDAEQITDLTGTTWVLNNTLNCPSGYGIFYVNFKDYDDYAGLRVGEYFKIGYRGNYTENDRMTMHFANGATPIYIGTDSLSLNNRIIIFIDGQDIANQSFVTWIQSNAIQVEYNNVTNSVWEFYNTTLKLWYMNSLLNFNITFESMEREYNSITSTRNIDYTESYLYYNDYSVYNNNTYWEDPELKTINITGGTDVTTDTFIYWLYGNATLISITPTPTPTPENIEVIPIMPMMFKILTMPFTFISQAFNVTLWEGTPYEFNFSNFILSLISIATLLFIIKLFTSGFSIIGNYSANHESRALKRSQTKLNNAKTQQIKNRTKDKPSKKG